MVARRVFGEADVQSAIDIAPMTNMQNGYSVLLVINLVDYTIVAHPNAPTLAPCQFEHPGGLGVWLRARIASRTRS